MIGSYSFPQKFFIINFPKGYYFSVSKHSLFPHVVFSTEDPYDFRTTTRRIHDEQAQQRGERPDAQDRKRRHRQI